MLKNDASFALFERASLLLVGGVNSPVRAFKSVGGTPVFMQQGEGAHLITADGERLIDYVLSWGALLLGHADPDVTTALIETVRSGVAFGAPCELELTLAALVQSFLPSMERIRFVNSGTEAVMTALRLARGATGRKLIVKFSGCYHGHADSMLVAAGSGALTLGHPDSLGVLPEVASATLVLDFNDVDGLNAAFSTFGDKMAGVIIEPVVGNMGVVPPQPGFLQTLRELCTRYGVVLIFDEVMTGFRVGLNGAQGLYGVTPDLTTLGKVIGGGIPCGAVGGQAALMEHLAPLGRVYQAGTMSGNPLAMAGGIATLQKLKDGKAFTRAAASAETLTDGIRSAFTEKGVAHCIQRVGTMFTVFFQEGPVRNLREAMQSDVGTFRRFFHHALANGVYFAPSQFEANFLSSVHSDGDLERTLVGIRGF